MFLNASRQLTTNSQKLTQFKFVTRSFFRFSSAFRYNIYTDDWVVFPERNRLHRPKQVPPEKKRNLKKHVIWDPNCPFCGGKDYEKSTKLLTINSRDILIIDKNSLKVDCHKNTLDVINKEIFHGSDKYTINRVSTDSNHEYNHKDLSDLTDYTVHVIPNKYPVVHPSGCLIPPSDYGAEFQFEKNKEGCSTLMNLLDKIAQKCSSVPISVPAAGFHEVVVDFPQHYKSMRFCNRLYWLLLLTAFKKRGEILSKAPLIQSVLCFKNSGILGGASIAHPHSQIVALPIVPRQQQKLHHQAMSYYESHGKCLMCDYLSFEVKEGSRIVTESEFFVALVPYAAHIPYHINIIPKRHRCQFFEIDDRELDDLGRMLEILFDKINFLLDEPDFNLVVRSAHFYREKWKMYNPEFFYHWYIETYPRLDSWPVAGFEFGSGIMANSHLPENDAEAYRSCEIKDSALW